MIIKYALSTPKVDVSCLSWYLSQDYNMDVFHTEEFSNWF